MFHQAPNVGESSISSQTRLTSSGGMRIDGSRVKNHLDKQSFYFNSRKNWNNLLMEVRKSQSVVQFKEKLKQWIQQNIPTR